ncbi:hypothetical protein [Halobellus sp. H-GB7]|uniref:hypothetical protein n=1 Tax=Halobellus sp. H-GB7 TaxID=3069756 RepID=UPI0027B068CF|nr:hypothetical protein [Halobellus sp. H-GB7]MDQ2053252.1 hypothetical protein [Halobellus sp. H-GB7]
MTTTRPTRPWYAPDALIDDYKNSLRDGGDLRMYRSLKVIRGIIVNLGIIGLAIYALIQGAEPTIIGTFALLTLAGYNGLEMSDYAALVQAYTEIQREGGTDSSDD